MAEMPKSCIQWVIGCEVLMRDVSTAQKFGPFNKYRVKKCAGFI